MSPARPAGRTVFSRKRWLLREDCPGRLRGGARPAESAVHAAGERKTINPATNRVGLCRPDTDAVPDRVEPPQLRGGCRQSGQRQDWAVGLHNRSVSPGGSQTRSRVSYVRLLKIISQANGLWRILRVVSPVPNRVRLDKIANHGAH